MLSRCGFPEAAEPGDLYIDLGTCEPGELPIRQAAIKLESGDAEDLYASVTDCGSGALLAVYAPRCCDPDQIFRPLEQGEAELEGYRARGVVFRRSGDPNTNLYTVTPSGDGTLWIRNSQEDRSLRFQLPEGVFRVCAGYTEPLSPANREALISPIQVLLELGGNALDFQVCGLHAKYGAGPWRRGGADCQCGPYVDATTHRLFCGDDCLGVLISYSSYFLNRPQLELLDTESYGPTLWYLRNRGETACRLLSPGGRQSEVPADGQVYRLEALWGEEERTNT